MTTMVSSFILVPIQKEIRGIIDQVLPAIRIGSFWMGTGECNWPYTSAIHVPKKYGSPQRHRKRTTSTFLKGQCRRWAHNHKWRTGTFPARMDAEWPWFYNHLLIQIIIGFMAGGNIDENRLRSNYRNFHAAGYRPSCITK